MRRQIHCRLEAICLVALHGSWLNLQHPTSHSHLFIQAFTLEQGIELHGILWPREIHDRIAHVVAALLVVWDIQEIELTLETTINHLKPQHLPWWVESLNPSNKKVRPGARPKHL